MRLWASFTSWKLRYRVLTLVLAILVYKILVMLFAYLQFVEGDDIVLYVIAVVALALSLAPRKKKTLARKTK